MADKAKKGAPKTKAAEESGELVFGAASNNDMVNFGAEDQTFGEKEREPNIIRKPYEISLISLTK